MTRRRTPSPVYLYSVVLGMICCWASNFIAGRFALRDFPPLLLAGLRAALASLMLLPVYAWDGRAATKPRWTRADVPMLLMLGLLGVATNQLFFVMGLNRTSVAHASLMIGLTPVLVLLIAAALRLEKLTLLKCVGLAIAFSGLYLLNTARLGRGAHPTLMGDFLVFLASLTFALFTVAGKRLTLYHSGLTVTTFAYVGGTLMLLPFSLWQSIGFDWAHVTAAGWLSLFYMAAFPSVCCYLAYYWALTYIPASRVSAFSYLQPPLATLMAVPLLHEPVTLAVAGGGALILAGVSLTERSR